MQQEIQVTLKGATLTDIATQALNLAAMVQGASTPVKVTKTTKAVKTSAVEVDETLLASDEEETDLLSDDDTTLMADEEAVEEVEAVVTKKAKAAKKLTEVDVNAAAVAHAKTHGKKETFKILGKFNVKSILELAEKDYAKVIKALEV
jgi:hypothetical protein